MPLPAALTLVRARASLPGRLARLNRSWVRPAARPSLRDSRLLLAGYVANAAADTALAGKGDCARARAARVVTKLGLMPLLAGSLLLDPRARTAPLRTSTLVAQGFSWGGDALLLGSGSRAFAAGASSFGAAHVAYVAGFLAHRDPGRRLVEQPAAHVAAGLALAAAPILEAAAADEDPTLGPAVVGYSLLLSTMLATSANLDPRLSPPARWATLAGAAWFAASDLALAVERFVVPPRRERLKRGMRRFVMGSYATAQLLLARGAALS